MCRIGPTSLPQSTVRGQTLIASADAARQPLAPPAPPHVEVDIFERRRRWRRRSRSRKSTSTCEPGADCDRSRRGSGPISARVTTDLAAEHDRPNGGERGIRTPGAPGAQRFSRPPHSAALSSLHARQPLEPFDARAGDPTLPPPPRCATPLPMPTRASRLNRLSRINGIGRADRRHPREKNPRLRVGLADAGTGEAGLSRRPSAKACAIAGHTGRRGMSVACRAW